MSSANLVILLWLLFSIPGGALASYCALVFYADWRDIQTDPRAGPMLRELVLVRFLMMVALVVAWATYILLGLAAAGVRLPEPIWTLAFFASMLFMFFAGLKVFRMAAGDGENGGSQHE